MGIFAHLKNHPYTKPALITLSWMPVLLFGLEHGYSLQKIEGRSMQPTLNPDSNHLKRDIVLLNKWIVSYRPIERGEVVLLTSPSDPHRTLAKRIIALQGDTVNTRDNETGISVLWIEQTFLFFLLVRIPSGHCWVEGDEGFHSRDSNLFGPVPISLISARVSYVLWPFSRFGPVEKKENNPQRVTSGLNITDYYS
ncbi:peptidase S24/S26A/S26B/S26C [Spinellus fusiger]|nr:peptidase S24/S26A/S26B/S26C [Spinellus fusiger]